MMEYKGSVARRGWLAKEPAPGWRGVLGRGARLAYLAGGGFFRDQCQLRATALAYVTILSVAPLLAVAFSISKALGLHNAEVTRELLFILTAGRGQIVDNIITYIENTGVGTLGAVGVLALFVAALSMLHTMELAFNAIWGVERGRSVWRKLTEYLSVLLVSPVLVFAALSLSVSLHGLEVVPFAGQLSALGLKAAPYVMVWLAFFLVYVFVPNTQVPLRPAAWAALVAGTLWQLAQYLYVQNQAAIATQTNLVYGGFAQFPLFLVWLYISWVIVLLGAEIAYALAHQASFRSELKARHIGLLERYKLAAACMLLLTERFSQSKGGLDEPALAARLKVPGKLVNSLVDGLTQAGFVVRSGGGGVQLVLLARPAESIRVLDVLNALEPKPADADCEDSAAACEARPPEQRVIDEVFAELAGHAGASEANLSFAELYRRACGEQPDIGCLEEEKPGEGNGKI